MKAIVYSKYGSPDVLSLQTIITPRPQKNEVLVRVHASTVSSGDWKMRKADPFAVRFANGLITPKRKVLGSEFAGTVEAAGCGVTEFEVGDKVFGGTGMALGTNADYVCVAKDSALVTMPANISFEQAAAVPFGATASLIFLNKAKIQPGHKVLINGASGALGVYAIQLAKYLGAKVTGVCSGKKTEKILSLGADQVIDYQTSDFVHNSEQYDIIFDTVGNLSLSYCRSSLTKQGIFVTAAGGLLEFSQMFWTARSGRQKVIAGIANESKEEMVFIKRLIEGGKLTPVIDRQFRLEEASKAHAYVEQGRKTGSVVLTAI